MVPCFMRYALFRSSGASGRACRTALRAATALPVKSSTESWSSLSWTALPPRSLKPSTGLTIPSCRLSCVSRLSAGFWVSISLAPVRRVEHLGQVQDAGVVSGAPQAPSEVQALHPFQQLARLAQQPELPPLVAARVKHCPSLPADAEAPPEIART